MKTLDLDSELRAIREALEEPWPDTDSAEVQIGRRVDFLVRELDEFCGMAQNPETRDLIENEAIALGQVHFRAGLILDFLRAVQPSKLRMIKNG